MTVAVPEQGQQRTAPRSWLSSNSRTLRKSGPSRGSLPMRSRRGRTMHPCARTLKRSHQIRHGARSTIRTVFAASTMTLLPWEHRSTYHFCPFPDRRSSRRSWSLTHPVAPIAVQHSRRRRFPSSIDLHLRHELLFVAAVKRANVDVGPSNGRPFLVRHASPSDIPGRHHAAMWRQWIPQVVRSHSLAPFSS